MFCSHCGKEIDDAAVVCVGCGCAVEPANEKWSTGAMVALVIGTLIIPLVGLIAGIIGLTKNGKKKTQGGILLGLAIIMMIGTWIMIASS